MTAKTHIVTLITRLPTLATVEDVHWETQERDFLGWYTFIMERHMPSPPGTEMRPTALRSTNGAI